MSKERDAISVKQLLADWQKHSGAECHVVGRLMQVGASSGLQHPVYALDEIACVTPPQEGKDIYAPRNARFEFNHRFVERNLGKRVVVRGFARDESQFEDFWTPMQPFSPTRWIEVHQMETLAQWRNNHPKLAQSDFEPEN